MRLSTIAITTVPFAVLLALLLFVGLSLIAAQSRPLPQLAGNTNWGQIQQAGRDLTISGNPHWSAVGSIRKDGTVLLIWTEIETQRVGFGVYAVAGTELVGAWGYADRVKLDAAGELEKRDPDDPEEEDFAIEEDRVRRVRD